MRAIGLFRGRAVVAETGVTLPPMRCICSESARRAGILPAPHVDHSTCINTGALPATTRGGAAAPERSWLPLVHDLIL
jgi:hypothetical protein